MKSNNKTQSVKALLSPTEAVALLKQVPQHEGCRKWINRLQLPARGG